METVSGAGLSYWTSQSLLSEELAKIRAKSMARIQPQAEGGTGGALLVDNAFTQIDDNVVRTQMSTSASVSTSSEARDRPGRYGNGSGNRDGMRGLDGGVEGESAMRDTYFRRGTPRKDG